MNMKNLEELRAQLDSIDTQIAKLLDERMQVTDLVAEYKNLHNLPLTDPGREQYIFQNIKKYISNNVLKETVEDIYQVIFSTSKTTRGFIKHTEMPFTKVAIIGLGLIGGSLAKALKAKNRNSTLSTIARNSENTKRAIEQNYIDHVYDSWRELLENVELVILTSSIDSIPQISKQIAAESSYLTHKVIVIDAASVKTNITKAFESLTTEHIEFLPTHPMGGSDKTGFEHAKATLFINRPWVITPHEKNTTHSIEKVTQLVKFLGSNVVKLDAQKHDEYAAIISHLVFLISTYIFAYPSNKHAEALTMAGSGFESITRLASGSAEMHAQIYENNKEYIEKALAEFIQFMQEDNKENIVEWFEKYKNKRDEFVKK